MAPRYFLFGMIRVPMYEYMYGHTAAQIELMTVDTTFTCYKAKSLAEKRKDPNYKPSKEKMMRAQRKWEERKRSGKTFDLGKFLGNGKTELNESKTK